MRNLKRALSLTLASVMLLGMMVIGTSAASYPDVSKDNNVEAIEVLQAVGVMQGDDKGNFDPDRTVSRNEMAIIMAKLLNLDYNYYSETCPFYDVPDYAKPYVGACYANGIVSGYNANYYGGSDTVTAVQAASMMMRALGYFQYDSDYADGFVLSTVKQASKIELFDSINANADTPLTRDQVAQLALNTLETGMVEAKDNTLNITGSSGGMNMAVTGGRVDYVYVTGDRSKSWTYAIDNVGATSVGNQNDGYIIELGEKLYNGDLVRREPTDDFGRPAVRWTYKADEIGVYAKNEQKILSSTAKVSLDQMYNLVGSANINALTSIDRALVDGDKDKLVVYQDGEIISAAGGTAQVKKYFDRNSSNGAQSGKGVLTEVFRDGDNNITIVYTNTYVAQAIDDYNSSKGNVNVTLLTTPVSCAGGTRTFGNWTFFSTIEDDEFDLVKDVKEDDYILYTYAQNKVQTIAIAEVLVGEVTAFSSSAKQTSPSLVLKDYGSAGGYVTIAGEQHDYAAYAETDSSNGCASEYTVGIDASVVVDADGYVVYVDEITASAGNYVYIDAVSTKSGLSETIIADGYFADGTKEELTIDKMYNSKADAAVRKPSSNELDLNLIDTTGRHQEIKKNVAADGDPADWKTSDIRGWYRYSKNNDGDYTLTLGATSNALDATPTFKPNKISMGAGGGVSYTGNNKTIYVIKDEDNKITIYTGVSNAPEITFGSYNGTAAYAYAMCDKNDTAKSASLVFVDVGDDGNVKGGTKDTLIYLLTLDKTMTVSNNNEPIQVWKAVMDGKEVTIETKQDWTTIGGAKTMMEDYSMDGDYYESGKLFNAWNGTTNDVDKYHDTLGGTATVRWDEGRFTMTGISGSKLPNTNTNATSRSLQVVDGHTKMTLVLLPDSVTDGKSNTASQLRRDIMKDWNSDYQVYEGPAAKTIYNTLRNYQVTGEAYVVYNDAADNNDLADEIFVVVTHVNDPGNTSHTAAITTGTSSVSNDSSSTFSGTVDSITVSSNTITVAATGTATNGDKLVLKVDPAKVTGSADKTTATLTFNGTSWTGDTTITVTAADRLTTTTYSIVVNVSAPAAKYTITPPASATSLTNGSFNVTASVTEAEEDDNVTVSVTPAAATSGAQVVQLKNGTDVLGFATFANGATAKQDITFKMPAKNVALTIADYTVKTPTVSITSSAATYTVGANASDVTALAASVSNKNVADSTVTYEWYKVATNTQTGGTKITGDKPDVSAAGEFYYYVVAKETVNGLTIPDATSTTSVKVTVAPVAPTWTNNSSTATAAGNVTIKSTSDFAEGKYYLYVGNTKHATAVTITSTTPDKKELAFTGVTGLTNGTESTFTIVIEVNGVESAKSTTSVAIDPSV